MYHLCPIYIVMFVNKMKFIPECKKCNKPIPLVWFLISNENKKYSCSSCGTEHQWSKRTNDILGLLVLFWIVLNGVARYFFAESMPRLIIGFIILLFIIYIFKLTRLTLVPRTNEKT